MNKQVLKALQTCVLYLQTFVLKLTPNILITHKNYCMRFYPIILLLFTSLICFGQSDWQKAKSSDGIDIFIRDVPNTAFKEFKGVTIFDTEPHVMYNIITDFQNNENWGYNVQNIRGGC